MPHARLGDSLHTLASTSSSLIGSDEEISAARWHAIMGRFADIHYEQTAIYGAAHASEHQSRFLLKRGDEIVAGAQVGIIKLPLIGRGMAIVRFGPFWRTPDAPADPDRYRQTMRALVEEYCHKRKLYLVVRPRAQPDIYPLETAVLEELGMRQSQATILDRYMVDISLSEDDQMKSFDQSWRAKLRKGLKHGVEIKLSDDESGAAEFSRLYAQMVGRKHLNYEGVERVDAIPELANLPDTMKLHVALAWHNDKPIGGATFAIVGDVAYYVFGASTAEALALHAGYLLQWQIINWLRSSGVRWYELGGPGDAGIRQFKRGLTGKRGVMLPIREFHYSPDAAATAVVTALFKLRDLRNTVRNWQRGRQRSENSA